MAITTAAVISDTTKFIRDQLRSNITDPLSRTSGIGFVMTSYPKRAVQYPIITVRKTDLVLGNRLGMQTETYYAAILIEVRVWARNEKEKDALTEQVINYLNTNQYPASTSNTSTNVELHDFRINSIVNVDEVDGQNGILSTVISCSYRFLYGF